MADAQQIAMFRQRNVEHLLAATAFVYPQYTLKECGWLPAARLVDERVRSFWQKLSERVTLSMTDDEANQAAIQAALEADIYRELLAWQADLGYTPMPQAYAHEIARRDYIVNMTQHAAQLQAAVLRFDDQEAKRIIARMHAETQQGQSSLPSALDIAAQFDLALNVSGRSIDTFIIPIDRALGGLERQTVTGLGARPGMGKTALSWQIARNCAEAGKRASYFSLEMSAVSLWARAACPVVGTTWRDVRAGQLNAKQLEELRAASMEIAERLGDNLRITEASHTTETLWRAVADHHPDLVVVDHLRRFKDSHTSEVKRLGIITETLSDMAKAFNCAVLLNIQLNRSVEARENKRPILSDLRDSGEIEENLDVCLMMYRDSYYNPPDTPQMLSKTEVWVRKFRDGPANILVNLDFDLRREWFEAHNK